MLTDFLKIPMDLLGAQGELAMSLLSRSFLHEVAPRADRRQPVIALPGFLSSGTSFSRMIRFLKQQGFNAQTWGMGRNQGLQGLSWPENLKRIESHMVKRIRNLADESGAPVSLIGHSLGGVYARELASRLESEIDRIITLGSPTFHPYRVDRHNQVVNSFAYYLNRRRTSEFGGRQGLVHYDPDKPALPCVAIHSPVDGFVDEHACHIPGYIIAQSDRRAPRENVRVMSSHVGMTVNPAVMLAVADRLLANRENWQVFDPESYFPWYMKNAARVLFPDARGIWEDRGTQQFVEMNQ